MCESVNTQVKKPIEIMKKNTTNAIATVNTTNAIATTETENKTNAIATTENNEKTNKILSLNEVELLFVECNVKPKFTDHKLYVGCGTKSNTFSVNTKQTKYNIYCNDDNFSLINALKLKNVKCVKNGNSTDTVRPNYIECKSTNELKTMLKTILQNNNKIALVQ